ELSGVEIQREYLEMAWAYYQGREASPQVLDILEKWAWVLDKLEEDPWQLHRHLDWVIKMELIRAYMERRKVGFEDQRISMLDLQFHDIKRSRGLYYLMARGDMIERMCTDGQIEGAMVEPPQTTRAKIRSDFIRYAVERNKSYDVGWSYLKLNDRYQRTILCKDPFQSRDARVEEMIASSYY
ncbi:MAG: proteasome accessory factor PafA2 family protein, partial [candidate division NC10 bacterium]